jgi:phosphoribosylformylglycinamidine synthase
MIHFFNHHNHYYYSVVTTQVLDAETIDKLCWLFGEATKVDAQELKLEKDKILIGPRASMISPWSTNAVEITQNMGIQGIERIEEYRVATKEDTNFDPMLTEQFTSLDQSIYTIEIQPEPIIAINDIAAFNEQEGLSLSEEEVLYLNKVADKIGRKLTDSEVFGFSQVNSEHCRHKIFNGSFVINDIEQEVSLFKMIKETSAKNPNDIVSAYKDNVAFVKGPGN